MSGNPFGNVKIGLALGGGAARGLAHVGVLRVLVENQIPIDLIVGTSIGALVGGLYASTGDIDLVEERLVSFLDSPTFRANRFHFLREMRSEPMGWIGNIGRIVRRGIFIGSALSRTSFISAQQFERNITMLLDEVRIEDAIIPVRRHRLRPAARRGDSPPGRTAAPRRLGLERDPGRPAAGDVGRADARGRGLVQQGARSRRVQDGGRRGDRRRHLFRAARHP
jgi:hypothetical protein